MALPGETGHINRVCDGCHTKLTAQIICSGAGYYIGTECHCGPYSRETSYYPSESAVRHALDNNDVVWRDGSDGPPKHFLQDL